MIIEAAAAGLQSFLLPKPLVVIASIIVDGLFPFIEHG